MTLERGLAELPHDRGKTVAVLGDAPLTPAVRENLVPDIGAAPLRTAHALATHHQPATA